MRTPASTWVEARADRVADVWNESAGRFDPTLSMGHHSGGAQCLTACDLPLLFGVPMGLTPFILGYSLISPAEDNLLDDENIPGDSRPRFSRRPRRRLMGEELSPDNEAARRVRTLIALR